MERDLVGYGQKPPTAGWPNGAALAVQIVLNFEEGGERSPLYGDAESESYLSELVGAEPWRGQRNPNMESMYEFGSRVGFWRLHRILTEADVPVTVFAVAQALAQLPEAVAAMCDANWEIASHGLRWIDYRDMPRDEERRHMQEAIRVHTEATGSRPLGWYTGRVSGNTLSLVMEEGGFAYTADSYADELPYWVGDCARRQLVVPYTLDVNDMRFAAPQGFNEGAQFFNYLRDSFDQMYEEGLAGRPAILSVGLHSRISGRPGRARALARFLDHVRSHDQVWLATRLDIARHWAQQVDQGL
ncbi:allantoinase PuuE [uncultured Sulfitobacter sp.]|uniref:allantoinase PuuE n=1 Tax=uncultured Sulfitobacter sp. TaxID=191468 RepID=UPI00338E6B5E